MEVFPQADMIDSEDMDELIVPPDGHPKVSAVTAIEYQQLWRDMVAEHMAKETSGYMVGGPGTTIEIDESMFGGFHHFLSPIQLNFFLVFYCFDDIIFRQAQIPSRPDHQPPPCLGAGRRGQVRGIVYTPA